MGRSEKIIDALYLTLYAHISKQFQITGAVMELGSTNDFNFSGWKKILEQRNNMVLQSSLEASSEDVLNLDILELTKVINETEFYKNLNAFVMQNTISCLTVTRLKALFVMASTYGIPIKSLDFVSLFAPNPYQDELFLKYRELYPAYFLAAGEFIQLHPEEHAIIFKSPTNMCLIVMPISVSEISEEMLFACKSKGIKIVTPKNLKSLIQNMFLVNSDMYNESAEMLLIPPCLSINSWLQKKNTL